MKPGHRKEEKKQTKRLLVCFFFFAGKARFAVGTAFPAAAGSIGHEGGSLNQPKLGNDPNAKARES